MPLPPHAKLESPAKHWPLEQQPDLQVDALQPDALLPPHEGATATTTPNMAPKPNARNEG